MAASKKPAGLEKSLSELEGLVEKLNDESLSLEESLHLFEKGVKLTRSCQTILKQAEQKISQLSADNTLTDFEQED
jgi:exodeoxyribonuclease VII small subunit